MAQSTPEERARKAAAMRDWLERQPPEYHEAKRLQARERRRASIATETEEQRAKRLARKRKNYRRRKNDTPEQREHRLALQREANHRYTHLTPKQKLARKRAKWKERKAATAEAIAAREALAAARAERHAAERAQREAEREAQRIAAMTPAASQPIPECPEEAALFKQLQLDAILFRSRVAPGMPCDPAHFVHGPGGVDTGGYSDAFDDEGDE